MTVADARSNFNTDRRNALLVSLALGLYTLLIVPIYFAFDRLMRRRFGRLMESPSATSSCSRASHRRAFCLA